jgi:hypothetical protein
MAAASRMLQIRDEMLSVVRMKFAFEMLSFRAIITWTLWLLLLVALHNWLIFIRCVVLHLTSCAPVTLNLDRQRRKKDWITNRKSQPVGGGSFFWLRDVKQQTWKKCDYFPWNIFPGLPLRFRAPTVYGVMLICGGYIITFDRLKSMYERKPTWCNCCINLL